MECEVWQLPKICLHPRNLKKGYNSSSIIKSVSEYAGLGPRVEVPICFRSQGLSKAVTLKTKT